MADRVTVQSIRVVPSIRSAVRSVVRVSKLHRYRQHKLFETPRHHLAVNRSTSVIHANIRPKSLTVHPKNNKSIERQGNLPLILTTLINLHHSNETSKPIKSQNSVPSSINCKTHSIRVTEVRRRKSSIAQSNHNKWINHESNKHLQEQTNCASVPDKFFQDIAIRDVTRLDNRNVITNPTINSWWGSIGSENGNLRDMHRKRKKKRRCSPLRLFFTLFTALLLGAVITAITMATLIKPKTTTASTTMLTTSVSTTTTSPYPTTAITRAGDAIIGVYNTTAGGSTGGVNATYSGPSEMPPYAIDNSTATKYLNYGNPGAITSSLTGSGVGTGFYVTPAISNATVACGLVFATANDRVERDPITVTLEGSNAWGVGALDLGSSWTLIYSGPTGINSTTDPGRTLYIAQQNFSNTVAYAHYRLLVTSKRNISDAVQYSKAQIMGYF